MTVLAKAWLGSSGHLPRPGSTLAGSRLKVCWARGTGREQAGESPGCAWACRAGAGSCLPASTAQTLPKRSSGSRICTFWVKADAMGTHSNQRDPPAPTLAHLLVGGTVVCAGLALPAQCPAVRRGWGTSLSTPANPIYELREKETPPIPQSLAGQQPQGTCLIRQYQARKVGEMGQQGAGS